MPCSRPAAAVLLFAAAMFPVGVEAQTTDTFEALQAVLEPGREVVITDDAGREIKGRVTEVSGSSLTLQMRKTKDNPQGRQIFAEDAVAKVVRTDSIVNGTLIGLGVGVVANWAYARSQCGPAGYDDECAANTAAHGIWTIVGPAVAVGALIDVAIIKTVFRSASRSSRSSLAVAPWAGAGTAGLALSLRF